ncbi:MAG: TonB-dependent receptor [Gammaproteobacteria bacterium]|nr:TonB-dependent receptor [Gammaproteobacteria bacterium]
MNIKHVAVGHVREYFIFYPATHPRNIYYCSQGDLPMKKRLLNGLCLLPVLLLTSNTVCGAQSSALPETIVSALRTESATTYLPASFTVIDRAAILASNAVTLDQILLGRAGISVTNPGTGAVIDMRGFGESAGSNVLVLIDGRRLNNTDIAAPDLNTIALDDVERIEIIEGSAGTVYGDQAVGGVINIITRKADALRAYAKVGVGAYNTYQADVGASQQWGFYGLRVNASDRHTDGYREHSKVDETFVSVRNEFTFESFGGLLEYQGAEQKQQTAGALSEDDAKSSPRISYEDFENDYINSNTDTGHAQVWLGFAEHFRAQLDVTRARDEQVFLQNFSGCALFSSCTTDPGNSLREQNTVNPQIEARYQLSAGELVSALGFERIDSDYKSFIPSSFGDFDRSNQQQTESLYSNTVIPVLPMLGVTVGLRTAKVDDELTDATDYPDGLKHDDSVTVYSLGATLRPIESLKLFVRFDQNYRFAKVDEQAFTALGSNGLEVQTGDTWELGAQWQSDVLYVKSSAYLLDLQNEIAFDPSADSGGFFPGANVNFDETRRVGGTLELGVNATSALSFVGAYTLTKAEFRSGVFAGNDVSGVPENVIRGAVNYQLADVSLSFETKRIGKQYLPGDNDNAADPLSGYNVSNFTLNYSVNQWNLGLRIDNLFNAQYYDYANSFGAYYPATGSNTWLSLAYRFE